jgi:hypothetical protein
LIKIEVTTDKDLVAQKSILSKRTWHNLGKLGGSPVVMVISLARFKASEADLIEPNLSLCAFSIKTSSHI